MGTFKNDVSKVIERNVIKLIQGYSREYLARKIIRKLRRHYLKTKKILNVHDRALWRHASKMLRCKLRRISCRKLRSYGVSLRKRFWAPCYEIFLSKSYCRKRKFYNTNSVGISYVWKSHSSSRLENRKIFKLPEVSVFSLEPQSVGGKLCNFLGLF